MIKTSLKIKPDRNDNVEEVLVLPRMGNKDLFGEVLVEQLSYTTITYIPCINIYLILILH